MKARTSFISAAMLVLLMISCISDLDKGPIDPRVKTSADVYTTTESYKQGLAKLYAAFILTGQQGGSGQPDVGGVDEGFSCFIRSLWNLQELTTDEAVWTYPNDASGTIFNLHYHSWVPSDGIPTALFARIMNVVALCNEFIRATAGKTDPTLKQFNAEARYLRALAYYYGIDLFGNLPFVTEANLPGAYFPPQKTRAELYTYVESELIAIENEMGDFRFEYGRADKGARAMLLAKLYLNAQVYIGTPKYNESVTELNKIFASGKYALATKYGNLFRADNHKETELIFTQNSDGLNSQSYDAVQVMIYGNAGYGGWSGLRTTSTFVTRFSVQAPTEGTASSRAFFATEAQGQSLDIDNVSASTQGYGIFKFRNVTSTGANGSSTAFQDTDFTMFRLADAYLMYAEGVLRGATTGNAAQALTYVNAIRTRSADVAAGNAPGVFAGPLTLGFILDERARELYWEGHRRSDLIRFGQFTGSTYLWQWKGGVKAGVSIPDTRALFPIPAADLGSNPNLKQNNGY